MTVSSVLSGFFPFSLGVQGASLIVGEQVFSSEGISLTLACGGELSTALSLSGQGTSTLKTQATMTIEIPPVVLSGAAQVNLTVGGYLAITDQYERSWAFTSAFPLEARRSVTILSYFENTWTLETPLVGSLEAAFLLGAPLSTTLERGQWQYTYLITGASLEAKRKFPCRLIDDDPGDSGAAIRVLM
jgi:hypothetical protein